MSRLSRCPDYPGYFIGQVCVTSQMQRSAEHVVKKCGICTGQITDFIGEVINSQN